MTIIPIFPFSPRLSYEELLQRENRNRPSTRAAGRAHVDCTAATSYLFYPSVNSCRPDRHGAANILHFVNCIPSSGVPYYNNPKYCRHRHGMGHAGEGRDMIY